MLTPDELAAARVAYALTGEPFFGQRMTNGHRVGTVMRVNQIPVQHWWWCEMLWDDAGGTSSANSMYLRPA